MNKKLILSFLIVTFVFQSGFSQQLDSSHSNTKTTESDFMISPAKNLGLEKGVMRRDPSDIIKVGNFFYVWYTKGPQYAGYYDAAIWYATSPDGHTWIEKGEAVARGSEGSWDEQSIFTPNILVAKGKYYLFFTGVSKPFFYGGPNKTPAALGIAISDSPDGPWKQPTSNPVFKPSGGDLTEFDGLRIDDACLVFRDNKYWLYYKGVQSYKTDGRETKMGVAIADNPEGPYVRYGKPVIAGGHEVIIWPYGKGVVALITTAGTDDIINTLQYSEDGVTFSKMMDLKKVPIAGGTYRPEAFTGSGKGIHIEWGIQIGGIPKRNEGDLPFLERFDYTW